MRRLLRLTLLCAVGCSSDPESHASPEAGHGADAGGPIRFRVTFRNTSDGSYRTSTGSELPVVFAPGVFSIGTGSPVLFRENEAASPGFEALAEDGSPSMALKELEVRDGFNGGAFGADTALTYDESPLLPGITADFVFDARADDRLEFAMMWAQSNDVFVATRPGGVPLFGDAGPLTGLVRAGISLWDAGTEVNQEPGIGDTQAARQAAPGSGAAEGGVITELASNRDANGFAYPSLDDTLEVMLALE